MSLKVTILGSGSAYGVPVIGGDWGTCDPSNPRNRRLAPSILVEKDDSRFLVDMGPDIKEQAEKHRIRDIDGIFFTHPHADHITGCFHLPMLMRYFHDNKHLPMYAERYTRKDIERVWWFQNDPNINVEYSGPGRPYWVEMFPEQTFSIGSIELTTFHQHHGRMMSMGFRIGNFAYSTDVNKFPESSEQYLRNLDTWIVECNCEEETTMHANLEKVFEWVDKFKPKQTWLTHLDHTMDYDRISAKLPSNIRLAYDNLVLEID